MIHDVVICVFRAKHADNELRSAQIGSRTISVRLRYHRDAHLLHTARLCSLTSSEQRRNRLPPPPPPIPHRFRLIDHKIHGFYGKFIDSKSEKRFDG
ncbi:hypothetical protein NECAME_03015 [Necator americanus]|uniref:Uncharacterized protein n=1 Tax=Necator americanus TaxID=51031 RepID=W2TA22_NECAM|nr:hypothetical protein NECAME_03015 [Necator americanus]ETN78056.1 hypothetical protein NECAME_03015 [Necator americanus]